MYIILLYRCGRQPSLIAGTNVSLHDIPTTTVSPELVTHTLTVTTPTYIDNTQSVAPSGDTTVTPSKPEAASNVSLEDLYSKPNKWRKQQNGDKNNPDYDNVSEPPMTGPTDTGLSMTWDKNPLYTETTHTGAEYSKKVESYAEISLDRNGNDPD